MWKVLETKQKAFVKCLQLDKWCLSICEKKRRRRKWKKSWKIKTLPWFWDINPICSPDMPLVWILFTFIYFSHTTSPASCTQLYYVQHKNKISDEIFFCFFGLKWSDQNVFVRCAYAPTRIYLSQFAISSTLLSLLFHLTLFFSLFFSFFYKCLKRVCVLLLLLRNMTSKSLISLPHTHTHTLP